MDNKKIIGQRINAALAKRKVQQKDLANAIGEKNANIISYYCKGERTPNYIQLVKIAKYLEVSTDYLLGVVGENNFTSDETIKKICAYTGLSNESVENLHYCVEQINEDNSYFEILNRIISGDDFYNSIFYLRRAKQMESKIAEEKKTDPDAYNMLQGVFEAVADKVVMSDTNDQGVKLSPRQSFEFYVQAAVECYRKLCNHILKRGEYNGKR